MKIRQLIHAMNNPHTITLENVNKRKARFYESVYEISYYFLDREVIAYCYSFLSNSILIYYE